MFSPSNLLTKIKSTCSLALTRLQSAMASQKTSTNSLGDHSKSREQLTKETSQADSMNLNPINGRLLPFADQLIFLHGLGDQGSSWQMQLEPMIQSHVKCVCPTAPTMAVTLNMGMRMPSWFDLRSLDPNDPEDEEGIVSASKRIHQLIEEQEKNGIPHDRIVLGGFSQGGALALYAAFTYPKKLAGVVALSCWLPLHKKVPASISEANKSMPVLQCHGDADFVVPIQWGTMSSQVMSTFLDKSHYNFKVYSGLGHSSSSAELNDVVRFIGSNLPKK